MEIIFIRHGHGEHLLDYPHRLLTLHPGLTEYGKRQVSQLRKHIAYIGGDLFMVSPTKRTIETALILTHNTNIIITPLVGPRMFPQRTDYPVYLCDRIYSKEEITTLYEDMTILDLGLDIWKEGINRLDQQLFEIYAQQLFNWSQERQMRRIIIISHDGTITNYRRLLGEQVGRQDFLGEAGVYKVNI